MNLFIYDPQVNFQDILFKRCFIEIPKRLTDTEELVQKSSLSAFSNLLNTDVNRLRHLIPEILKISSVLFSKTQLFMDIVEDISCFLSRCGKECISELPCVEEFINCLMHKLEEKIESREFLGVSLLIENITRLIISHAFNIAHFIPYLMDLSLVILQNFLEKEEEIELKSEIIVTAMNLISNSYNNFSTVMNEYTNKKIIRDVILRILEIEEDYVRHFVVALIGEITMHDNSIFVFHAKFIAENIIDFMDYDQEKENDKFKLYLINNASWTLGILSKFYEKTIADNIEEIVQKNFKILAIRLVRKLI